MEHRPNKDNSVGPMVGIIIIVLILVLGGLYFWGERLSAQRELRHAKAPTARSASSTLAEMNVSASTSPEYR